jgi:hypothetical protein
MNIILSLFYIFILVLLLILFLWYFDLYNTPFSRHLNWLVDKLVMIVDLKQACLTLCIMQHIPILITDKRQNYAYRYYRLALQSHQLILKTIKWLYGYTIWNILIYLNEIRKLKYMMQLDSELWWEAYKTPI